jgi:hypothetical protein
VTVDSKTRSRPHGRLLSRIGVVSAVGPVATVLIVAALVVARLGRAGRAALVVARLGRGMDAAVVADLELAGCHGGVVTAEPLPAPVVTLIAYESGLGRG